MEVDYNAATTAAEARERYDAIKRRGETVLKILAVARGELKAGEAGHAAAESALAHLAAAEFDGKAPDADAIASAVAAAEKARIGLFWPQARVSAAEAGLKSSLAALGTAEREAAHAEAAARTAATRARVLELTDHR